MTSVKWLTRIEAVTEPFAGYQQAAYRYRTGPDDPGIPVQGIGPAPFCCRRDSPTS